MLGFGALGQLALGEIPHLPFIPAERPGTGPGHHRFNFVPEPAYEEKPRPPFRPVWDKPREGKVEQQQPQLPRPVPMPPASIFAAPHDEALPPVTATAPFGLPDFNNLVPPDPVGLGQRTQEAQDMSDALAVLRALGLMGPNSVN